MHIFLETLLVAIFALKAIATADSNIEALQAVSDGTSQFSSLFYQTVAEETPENLITSPLSAAVVLAMAAYGSRGETENQFKKVLHLPSANGESGYQALIDNLNKIQENKLQLANKIFAAEKFGLKPTYKELTETYFRSIVQAVNFAKSQEAAATINEWVQQNTNDLIKIIVQPGDLDSKTALVLVNAVYFKGLWKDPFNPNNTKDMPFHIDSNTVKNVPTMFKTGSYRSGELPDLNAKFIVIPYKGNECSMVIVLPNAVDGLADLEKKLQNVNLVNVLTQGYEKKLVLLLPKFKVESKINLEEVLQKMGLIDAFSGRANFSGIANEQIAISKAVQKAFIEVNEEGTEAAAVTGTGMTYSSSINLVELRVNRPFVYSIIKTGDVNIQLFRGHVIKPETA
ncbi:unnamed protein product [Xylocopa violacea]|uniref:Serpin domain-containing protein n=1 Tax=Xylocopa violacea TaxID=135666 RepID=A0ABP1NIK5_XYLVO